MRDTGFKAVSSMAVISYLLSGVLVVSDAQAQNSNRSHRAEMDDGIRIHFRDRVFDLANISTSGDPASIACAKIASGETRIICSVGDGVNSIDRVMDNAGEDPGDCVVFVDTQTGGFERTSYHQPRPDHIVTSTDGKYAAMASEHGWSTSGADIPELKKNNRGTTMHLPLGEINKQLREITVGTLRYSIWETAPVRPVWEMRFYDKTAKAGAEARFERPWERYAKLSVPWWAINDAVLIYRDCRIGFSPDSKYFVALDPAHGIHVLNVVDGEQFHCSPSIEGRKPLMFVFLENGSQIGVICEDSSVRVFTLETGREVKEHQYQIPSGATIRTMKDAGFYPRVNFGVDVNSALFGFISDRQHLTVAGIGNGGSKGTVKRIHEIGREFGAGRLDRSADGRYLGIGYGLQTSETEVDYPRRIVMYEVADLESGHVISRVSHSFYKIADSGKGVPTIMVDDNIQACLDSNGRDIIYAYSLPKIFEKK